jgi:hypothetical protein
MTIKVIPIDRTFHCHSSKHEKMMKKIAQKIHSTFFAKMTLERRIVDLQKQIDKETLQIQKIDKVALKLRRELRDLEHELTTLEDTSSASSTSDPLLPPLAPGEFLAKDAEMPLSWEQAEELEKKYGKNEISSQKKLTWFQVRSAKCFGSACSNFHDFVRFSFFCPGSSSFHTSSIQWCIVVSRHRLCSHSRLRDDDNHVDDDRLEFWAALCPRTEKV